MAELSAVAEVFAEFLAAREDGGGDDIEPFCRAHPRLADRLRRMHADWLRLEGALGPARTSAATDRYEVGECLARGGMGSVFRVYDRHLRRELAMKVMRGAESGSSSKASSDPRSLSRFLDEARVTGQLQHPGIPAVHDLGIDACGRVFFTMPLLSGSTLQQVIEAVRRGEPAWPLQRVLGVLLKVCEAVAFAHAQGVIHRDLKPGNVMVGRFGETFVMDWGLARVLGEAAGAADGGIASDRSELARREPDSPLVTRHGDVVGTPVYMPPEQARGELERLGPRVDVYAAGAMLYHVVAGTPPYGDASSSSQAVIERILAGPAPRLDEVQPAAPPELAAICSRAMAARPEDRYADMGEFAADLRAFLEVRVVRAYETGAFAAFKKFVRRNKAAALAAFAAFGALVVGTLVSVQQARFAEASNAMSLDAVERMLERVASSRLDDVPRAYPVRQQLVLDAIALYEQMLVRRGDDPETRARLARCWHQLGKVQYKLGDPQQSSVSQQRAIELYDQLVGEQPTRAQPVIARASARLSLGTVLMNRGAVEPAERQLRDAAAELAGLTGPEDTVAWLEGRCSVHGQLGTLLLRTRRSLEALEQRRQQVALARQIAQLDARVPQQELLARSLDQLGNALFELDRPHEAAPPHEEAVAILKPLHAADPSAESVRANYAAALNNLGRCLDVANRNPEALAAWRQAAELWRSILADHPEVPTWHSVLGTTLANIARREPDVAVAAQNWHEAVQAHAAAVARSKDDVTFRQTWRQHLRDRATWLCERRLHREAVAAAADLVAAAPEDADAALAAATFVGHAARIGASDASLSAEARAAHAVECRQAALAYLRQAIDRGCRDRERFAADHFAFLRGDAAYEELLAALPPDRPRC
jgi:serine/threonine-protein kinase